MGFRGKYLVNKNVIYYNKIVSFVENKIIMPTRPLLLNFSGAGTRFALETGAEVLDLSSLEGTNCYCDPDSEERIRGLLRKVAFPSGMGETAYPVRWIDTGDYHYLSCIIAGESRRPFDLLLLDNHPDMQEPALGDILSCGDWVKTMLDRNHMLGNVGIIGIDGSLKECTSGYGRRVRVVTREEIGDSTGEKLEGIVREIISFDTLDNDIYLSIDKDVLDCEIYKTDWSQGTMALHQLETVLETVFSMRRVSGVDVCGGLPASKGGVDPEINLKTDVKLWEIIDNLLKKQYLCSV